MDFFRPICAILSATLLCALVGSAGADTAYFVRGNYLTRFDGQDALPLGHQLAGPGSKEAMDFATIWGNFPDGSVLVTLRPNKSAAAADTDTCEHAPEGGAIALIKSDGTLADTVTTNALRAFPCAATGAIALISQDRDLTIWKSGATTRIAAPGRVSNLGWSPDGTKAVLAVYPPDWSVQAVNNARTTAEFLRLQSCNLYLLDATTLVVGEKLTDNDGTNYGPFFSPDGQTLYFTWLHPTENRGGLMRLPLGQPGAKPTQITEAGQGPGQAPVARVGTYVWQRGGTELIYETGVPDGSGEIWTIGSAGGPARKLSAGRHPQRLTDTAVAFSDNEGKPVKLDLNSRPGGTQ
ncbi:MAG: hypothetical protein K1X53_16465 [Candidatus Sumerlaeaceae bacterium]|nr:hypothetical protein [Candidatus Sumerlaeaceae bacterium]